MREGGSFVLSLRSRRGSPSLKRVTSVKVLFVFETETIGHFGLCEREGVPHTHTHVRVCTYLCDHSHKFTCSHTRSHRPHTHASTCLYSYISTFIHKPHAVTHVHTDHTPCSHTRSHRPRAHTTLPLTSPSDTTRSFAVVLVVMILSSLVQIWLSGSCHLGPPLRGRGGERGKVGKGLGNPPFRARGGSTKYELLRLKIAPLYSL